MQRVSPAQGERRAMSAGLIDGLTIIAAIQAEQDCTWDAAKRLWHINLEMEAEARAKAAPPSNVIQGPWRR
jgi:hypothetical protein